MNTKHLFLLIIILLLLNIIVSENTKIKEVGEIKEIDYTTNKITITLKNSKNKYIMFTNNLIKIKKDDTVEIYGKEENYKNEKQIIVSKITKLNTKIRT